MLGSEIDAVLFDAGGTLVHLDYAYIARAARERGVEIGEETLPHAEAVARRALDARARAEGQVTGNDDGRRGSYFGTLLRAAGTPDERLDALLGDLEAAHRADNLWRIPLPGAAATLAALRSQGRRTAVVSNADGRIEQILASVGLGVHLDVIVDSHLEGVEKPDPEIFRRGLRRLRIAAERAAYIGDIYSIDALGARAAGLAPILIDPTGGYRGVDCPTIARLSELVTPGVATPGEDGSRGDRA